MSWSTDRTTPILFKLFQLRSGGGCVMQLPFLMCDRAVTLESLHGDDGENRARLIHFLYGK